VYKLNCEKKKLTVLLYLAAGYIKFLLQIRITSFVIYMFVVIRL